MTKKATLIKVNLRHIEWPADFRKTDATLYNAIPKAVRDSLRGRDAICFVAGRGNQVLFVYKAINVGWTQGNINYPSRERQLVPSVRLRLNIGQFNPEMLADYAEQVGIELVGLPKFRDRYAYLIEADA